MAHLSYSLPSSSGMCVCFQPEERMFSFKRKDFVSENKLGRISAASWDTVLLQKTFPFCITWHPKTHQHSVNTGDEDYWLIKSRSNGVAFHERHKNILMDPRQYHNWLTSIFRDQFLQSIMCLFYSPSEMQSWWSQGAQRDFEVQKSRSRRWKIHIPGFSPLRYSDLKWTEWNWANWK